RRRKTFAAACMPGRSVPRPRRRRTTTGGRAAPEARLDRPVTVPAPEAPERFGARAGRIPARVDDDPRHGRIERLPALALRKIGVPARIGERPGSLAFAEPTLDDALVGPAFDEHAPDVAPGRDR